MQHQLRGTSQKQNQKARIESEHTHAIPHRKTKTLIEYMRAMISYYLQHTQITTPSQNQKHKFRSVYQKPSQRLTDILM